MAAPYPGVGHIITTQGNALAEDVTDIIYQITPEDKPFWMISGETTAGQPRHEWQRRELTTRQDNAAAEGFVYSMTGPQTLPSRIANFTQIMKKEIRVSNTQQAADFYGIGDMFADQMEIRLAELGTDAEHALLRGSWSTGATDGARRMQGLIQAITSNATTYTTVTTTLNEDRFNDHIQAAWDLGGAPRDVLVGGKLKRMISAFTAGGTRYIPHDQGKVVNTISLYESDFFPVQVHLSRDILKNTDDNNSTGLAVSLYTGYAILFMDRTMTRKAFYRRFSSNRTPPVADSADGVIVGEMTLEWGHPSAHVYADRYRNF